MAADHAVETEPVVARPTMGTLERWRAVASTDRAADAAFGAAIAVAVVVWVIVGHQQWFIRDDWAFLLTRDDIAEGFGLWRALMEPQDGHFMAFPVLTYRFIVSVFGIGSYAPFLVVLLMTHLGIVWLSRLLCLRVGASRWTSTLIASVLLVFGSGWENVVFAIQITYNYSLLAFLAHLLLVDHEGRVDRRDYIGAGLGVVSVASSGFGPFFVFGVGLLLVLRRRWVAAAVAVVPQGLLLGWWWLRWGADPAGDQVEPTLRAVLRFTRDGVFATMGALAGTWMLAGTFVIGALVVAVWRGITNEPRTMLITLWVTTLAMFVGIGLGRVGVQAGTPSRYVYMAAMMLAPAVALAIDQCARFAPRALLIARLVLIVAIVRNVMLLSDNGAAWAARANDERSTLELVAATEIPPTVDPQRALLDFSPDVGVGDLARLVADGAIEPRVAITDAERERVADALGVTVDQLVFATP